MSSVRSTHVVVLASVLLLFVGADCSGDRSSPLNELASRPADSTVERDVPYVTSSDSVVTRMLELAEVGPGDTVYDLGSGDGRIVITAAQRYRAYGVGIEIDPVRVLEAREKAEAAGVADRVEFRQGDLFESDFSDADVVTLYLLPSVNQKLRPLLFEQLDPGTRVVSHNFKMGAWAPDSSEQVGPSNVYRWTIPDERPDTLQSDSLSSP
ncbi:MAG: SAM-dependent methyltransferase [Salinivenus sp.]